MAAVMPMVVVAAAGPAGAKTKAPKPAIKCNVTGNATISPGVSETPNKQTLTVTLSLSGCTGSSVAGITGTSKSGTTTEVGKTTETCANLVEAGKPTSSTGTVNWNNATTSTEKVKTTLGDPSATQATGSGKITAGTFVKGKIAVALNYQLGSGQNCTSVPVTSATITGTYTIT